MWGNVLCRGSGGQKSARSRDEAPVGGLGDFVHQKLKQFWIYIWIILT